MRHNDQQVDIRICGRLTVAIRAKQNHFLGVKLINNFPYKRIDALSLDHIETLQCLVLFSKPEYKYQPFTSQKKLKMGYTRGGKTLYCCMFG
jgi:hypothetical protein